MVIMLQKQSGSIKSYCGKQDGFFSPGKWLGPQPTKRENFEAVVARAYALQLACGNKKDVLKFGRATMVESGLTVMIREAELDLLKSSIERVKEDETNLFFVFLRAQTKYDGCTEVLNVLPLCERVGKGISTLVRNVRRRNVGRRTIPAMHTFSFNGDEGLSFDYDKFETIKSCKHWKEK